MENAVFSVILSLTLQANNQIVKWKLKMDGKSDHMNTYKWSTCHKIWDKHTRDASAQPCQAMNL